MVYMHIVLSCTAMRGRRSEVEGPTPETNKRTKRTNNEQTKAISQKSGSCSETHFPIPPIPPECADDGLLVLPPPMRL